MAETPLYLLFRVASSFFLVLILCNHATSQLHEPELSLLLRLNQFWQSPPPLSHWSSSNTSLCSWPEVSCSGGSVTNLSFVNYNIAGAFPPFICDLKNLTVLDLRLNLIASRFPTVLYNCSKLTHLDLSQNYFVGPIPDDVDRLSGLQFLRLEGNNFSGDIPVAIGRLSELRYLSFRKNQFNGSYPPEIGDLSNLEELDMGYLEKLVPAQLPSSFTQLKKLKSLWMTASNVIGKIPETIGNMTALENLDLSRNGLVGEVPAVLFTLTNLTLLYLFKNNLSGEIPQRIESTKISEFDLSENNLTGKIPEDIGNLQELIALLLSENRLSGEIPESIGRLPLLTDIRLFSNDLTGTLPPDFGRYSKIVGFQVNSNRLTGSLPDHLCSGGELMGLTAYENNLSGELPESLGNCSSLLLLSVHRNNFSGKIPSGLWTSLNLTSVKMSHNSFTGELPEKVSMNLSRLEISNNKFSGKIPTGVSSWRQLQEFEASNNLFTGRVPEELTALPYLMKLKLDRNRLSGDLPSNIISWRSLTELNLSGNHLTGKIPEEIGLLPAFTTLDLSENQFSGTIPSQLGNLKPVFLNLSSNFLTGIIPYAFDNAVYARSFLNNPGLCASNALRNLYVCNYGSQNSGKISSHHLALIISFSIIATIISVLSVLFIIRTYRKRKDRVDVEWKLTSFQRLNFSESKLVSGLTENNEIGSGGSGKVYRIPVSLHGDIVAVKRIWNNRKSDHKLEKEFMAEVKILSSIRHKNIVKLLCCVSCETSKLLVYEYMEKQSLDKWLHKKNKSSRISGSGFVLDWPTRYQIAVGAAQGLFYMHHECSPPIIHRDIKSSNILLDSEFNAKIADFGLAKLLVKQGESASVSAVAGSFGYIAPEYAQMPRINEKIDVFSFGVILLELATGKEALDGDGNSALVEWAWNHIQEGKPLTDALDDDIKEPCYLDEMCSVFKLGVICTGTLPSSRPTMSQVLQILIRCQSSVATDHGGDKGRVQSGTPLSSTSKGERQPGDDMDDDFKSVV